MQMLMADGDMGLDRKASQEGRKQANVIKHQYQASNTEKIKKVFYLEKCKIIKIN